MAALFIGIAETQAADAAGSSPAKRGRGNMRSMVEGAITGAALGLRPLHRLRRSPSPVASDGGGASGAAPC